LEILLICILIFLYSLLRKNNKGSKTNSQKTDLTSAKVQKKSIVKKKYKKKYNLGQKKSKPKIDPMSKVDPIEWSKFTVCDICGSENKGSIVRCHPQ